MLLDDIKKEQMLALKEHNADKRAVLEAVYSKGMLVKIEKRGKGQEMTDADVYLVINKVVKELEEEIEAFSKANRLEKVESLTNQKDIIKAYLPKQMSKEEIKEEIMKLEDHSIPTVMKHFKTNFQGTCDMRLVQEVLKELN